jgi:hypothetical protein
MKQQFRLKDIDVIGYCFLQHQGLVWHSGEFWYNEIKCKKVYNNGSISLLVGNSKLSIKKLRKQAIKCQIKLLKEKCPF